MVGGDGTNLHADHVLHIELHTLARKHPLLTAALARHFINQRNTLALRRNQIIKLRRFLEQLRRAGLGQLAVAKDDERADGKLVVKRANGQIALTAGDCHVIMRIHGVEPSFLPPENRGNNHRFYYTLISFFVNECARHFSCFYATILRFCVKTKQKQDFGASAGLKIERFLQI